MIQKLIFSLSKKTNEKAFRLEICNNFFKWPVKLRENLAFEQFVGFEQDNFARVNFGSTFDHFK